MNSIFTRYSPIFLGFCLLLGAGVPLSRVNAQDVTSTPQTSQPLIIFTEMGHAPTSLVFTINYDATVTLAIIRHGKDTNQALWQDSGTIRQSQLDKVIGLPKQLATATDQSWHDKDYTFEFPTADGNKKPLELYNGYQHVDPDMDATLQKVVQTLLDIRKPLEPLVVFGWSGGFAGRDTQLAIMADGTAIYEDQHRKAVANGQMAPSDMQKLERLLQDSSFSSSPRSERGNCNDCWVYSIFALTADGLQTIVVDDVTLDPAPKQVKDLVALLTHLSDQLALIQVTVTSQTNSPTFTPTPAATPTITCCTNTIKPGDSSRYIGVLGSKDVMVGAAKLLQLRPDEAPTECVVLIFHGPLSYDVTFFDGFWLQTENNPTPEVLDALTQSATDTVTESCGKGHVQILRIP